MLLVGAWIVHHLDLSAITLRRAACSGQGCFQCHTIDDLLDRAEHPDPASTTLTGGIMPPVHKSPQTAPLTNLHHWFGGQGGRCGQPVRSAATVQAADGVTSLPVASVPRPPVQANYPDRVVVRVVGRPANRLGVHRPTLLAVRVDDRPEWHGDGGTSESSNPSFDPDPLAFENGVRPRQRLGFDGTSNHG